MSRVPSPDPHVPARLEQLLADRATQGLSPRERAELEALLAVMPGADPDCMDRAAAALDLAFSRQVEGAGPYTAPVPTEVWQRLEDSVAAWAAAPCPGRDRGSAASPAIHAPAAPGPRAIKERRRWAGSAGWLAAAASLALAAAVWSVGGRGGSAAPGVLAAVPAAQRDAFARSAPDARTARWSDFNSFSDGSPPEIRGVAGGVVWSESRQTGYMTFRNLPPNPAASYQLWIVDDRGLNQRISGGIFTGSGGGSAVPAEIVVPIHPSLPIRNAAAFAVTIEPAGGSALSDMTRRVVIASLPPG